RSRGDGGRGTNSPLETSPGRSGSRGGASSRSRIVRRPRPSAPMSGGTTGSVLRFGARSNRSRPGGRAYPRRAPVAQPGQGSGLLIRRSWVRIPPGAPSRCPRSVVRERRGGGLRVPAADRAFRCGDILVADEDVQWVAGGGGAGVVDE